MIKKTIQQVMVEVHDNAREHGWWDAHKKSDGTIDILTADEILAKNMLVVTELSEAVELAREPDFNSYQPPLVFFQEPGNPRRTQWPKHLLGHYIEIPWSPDLKGTMPKPEGFGVELADAVIRCFDLAEAMKIDLPALIELKHQYNKSRPFKHGNKRA
jgi:hypothetical protein